MNSLSPAVKDGGVNLPLNSRMGEINRVFTPHSPVTDEASFQGRQRERDQLEEAILTPGLHVLVYGERGAGKTSLATVGTASHPGIKVFCPPDGSFADLAKDICRALDRAKPSEFIFDADQNRMHFSGSIFKLDSITGNDLAYILPKDGPFSIVLDELDLMSAQAKADVAMFCKNLSTFHTHITLVMVGVAETADELLAGHASNIRNLLHVRLGKMKGEDLFAILRRGVQELKVQMDALIMSQIVGASDNYPYYVHLIAMETVWAADRRRSAIIEQKDLDEGLRRAASGADQTLKEVYERATVSRNGNDNYRWVVWGITQVQHNLFSPRQVMHETNQLLRREGLPELTMDKVRGVLRGLTAESRGYLLKPVGSAFRLSNPLMCGYVGLVRTSGLSTVA